MLSERKHTILQSLIQEYVISAHPVASSTLVRYYVPLLSSATVRNELSWLEDRGYVVAPHTSAGRLPTTVGYRTFVNSLLLHPQQQSPLTGRANRADTHTRITKAVLPQMDPAGSALTLLSAAVDKLPLIPDALGILAERNKCLMVFWAPQLSSSVIHRGLPLLLSQPEFAESSSALPIMQLLESHGDLMAIFNDVVTVGGLHIKIGSEHRDALLYEFSLVAMRFDCTHLEHATGLGHKTGLSSKKNQGVVALFGPTRMDYELAIASISNLVHDLECAGRQ